ncbi:YrdB family protein [Streptomyces coelicoflavus]|uniref:YrdB family protein n=1 Tax=Streptomyces coelicoflavus TaxID=285562 RepID=A0A7K3PFF3_9ACTN|nr:YrdB family protein [Streptomyces coelicoflavus]
MLSSLKSLNLLLMFLLELAVYVAVVLWGIAVGDRWPVEAALGAGAPAVMMTAWALFGSPRAAHPARGAWRIVLEVLWFGAGAAALAASGRPRWAVAFAGVCLVNAALRRLWRQ